LSGVAYVSEELRERVLRAVKDLDYSPDGIARSMSQRRTLTLGLVVSDITNPFFTAVSRGVEDTGQKSGYSVVLCNTDEDVEKERGYLRVLREKRVDGILLTTAGREGGHIQRLVEAGTKLVLIDRSIPGLSVPSVQVDNFGGVHRATEYLLNLGHRRIGIVTGRLSVSTADERLRGYEGALAAATVQLDPSLIVSGHFTEEGGHEAGRNLLSRSHRPTAVISCNNFMTTGLLVALREGGSRVPEDVSVISFDDLPYFALLDHPVTVISQPMYDLGRSACELLLRLITGELSPSSSKAHIRLPTGLVIRESCRRVDSQNE